MKLEADAIRDGLLRYAQSCEYQLATDSKPIRQLLYHSLKPLADAILAEQLELKTAQRQAALLRHMKSAGGETGAPPQYSSPLQFSSRSAMGWSF
jgi:hypothetical protein